MAIYTIEAPDGSVYDVEGPEGATAEELGAFISKQAAKPEPYDLPAGVKSLMNVAQSVSLGFGDEIAGALGADKARYRATIDQFKEEYPKSAFLGQISGAALLPGASMKAFANAPFAAAATVGGIAGGVQGAGDSKDLQSTIPDAATGLLSGAALAPVLLGTANAGGSLLGALGTKLPVVGDDIAQSLARRHVARSFNRDNVTAEQVGQRMRELGPEARIADAAGENTRGVLNLNAYLPGQTANNLEELIRARVANRPDRMETVVDMVSDGMGRAKSLITSLTEQQRKTAAPLYQRAHSQSIAADKELIEILNAAKGVGAFGQARTIATAERSPFSLDKLSEGTSTSSVNTLTNQVTTKTTDASKLAIKDLDYVKRGLDALIEKETNEFGKVSSKGVAYINLKKDLLSKVDAMSPEFKAARQAFAGPESLKTAITKGKAFWNEDADRLADIVGDMTLSEQQAFRVGAAEKLREMVGSPTGQNRLLNMWQDKNTRKKLEALLGDNVKYSEVEKFIAGEATLKRLERLGPSRNSRTAQVEAMNENQSAENLADTLSLGADVARGGVVGPVTRVARMYGRLGTPESVRDGIGKILMQQYMPAEMKALMEAQDALMRAKAQAAGASGIAGGIAGQQPKGLFD